MTWRHQYPGTVAGKRQWCGELQAREEVWIADLQSQDWQIDSVASNEGITLPLLLTLHLEHRTLREEMVQKMQFAKGKCSACWKIHLSAVGYGGGAKNYKWQFV